ncbi:SCO family protein [Rhodobacter ferrooxidans]|uniref:Electron transport protein SCO1/SenC n=1 Tax=Rhodobacter ferrooxidans TaxID=371731 RepID=C8S130_9RHOB|nr:SCO family protein [Rhodobacter sp. SW2]EEW25228.1 electron transport protein SCO1/SenC [Rhodobacter sp. SW2]
MTRLSAWLAAGMTAVIVAVSVWAAYFRGGNDIFAECRSGQVAGGEIGGPLNLIDETGAAVTEKEMLAKPSLVYFGYTFCPDVCPLDNARNAAAVDILEEQGIEVTPVFISVDSARDTPETLTSFTDSLHPRMIGYTGTAEQIKAASLAYKTYFKIKNPEEEYYLIDHSTFTYLMLPGIGFVDFFKRDATPDQMAESVACYVNTAAVQQR